MVGNKCVDHFKIKNFLKTFFPYLVYFGRKFEFFIFTKTFCMNNNKIVKSLFVDLSETNNFVFQYFFRISQRFGAE